jgi:hypothetical protein
MDAKKAHYGLIALLVLLFAGLLFSADEANAMLTAKSHELTDLKAKKQAAEAGKLQLVKDKKDITKYDSLNTIAKSVVPQDKDQAEAVREIVNLAGKSGIPQLSSITFPASTLGVVTKGKKTSGGVTQVTPVKSISGVEDLQITITQDNTAEVPYANFIKFLSRLEQNRRTAVVSSITVQPDQKSPGQVSFTLVIDEFIKP